MERRQSCASRLRRGRARRHGRIRQLRLSAFRLRIFFVLPFFSSSCPGIAVRRTASLRSPMPGIHAEASLAQALPPALGRDASAWTTGSKSGGDDFREWLLIARALRRAARRILLTQARSAKRGGGGRTRTYEGVSQRIYSPPPLPLGTLPRNRGAGIIRAGAIWLDGNV